MILSAHRPGTSPWSLAAVAAALCCPPAPIAQEPLPDPLPTAFFAGRRDALMERVRAANPDGRNLVLLLAGPKVDDKWSEFRQDNEFYYLTGVSEPEVALLLDADAGRDELLVFPFNRFTATWDGERLVPGDDTAAALGFDAVGNVRLLDPVLEERLAADEAGTRPTLWTIAPAARRGRRTRGGDRPEPLTARPSRAEAVVAHLKQRFEGLDVRDVTGHVNALRGVKTAEEIESIRKSTEVACHGIAEAMKSTQPGMYEYQVAAVARYVFTRLGAGHDAYQAIVGGGPNGCVLHYRAGERALHEDDLIVMDYGGTINNYATDVTRTFPANGKFSPAQRKLVEDVYEVQQQLIGMVRPGATLRDLSRSCGELLRAKGYGVDHGPCHHVGLDVHDQGRGPLVPGMLITVEPGAYLRDVGMGCRIEDVVLVTEDGCVNLSGHLPARPDDIEALMAQPGIAQVPIGLPAAADAARKQD